MIHLMRQKAIVKRSEGGTDRWGRPTAVVTPLTYACRIDEGSKMVADQEGREVVSTARILFYGPVQVTHSDVITWTDTAGAERSSKPINIKFFRDSVRIRATEVFV